MHEEAVLRDLRRKLIEVTHAEGDPPVRRVRVWVGALAHVTPDVLRLRWPDVVTGTPAQTAELAVDVSTDPSDPAALGIRLVEVTVDAGGSVLPPVPARGGAA